MPAASASRESAKRQTTPSIVQLAFARRLVAGEDLHQRRLARAVLAEQAVDLARRELEAHAVQHAHGAEVLADAGEGDAQAHRGATQVPPAAEEATAASMKATPAMPSSMVGNCAAGSAGLPPLRAARIACAISL